MVGAYLPERSTAYMVEWQPTRPLMVRVREALAGARKPRTIQSFHPSQSDIEAAAELAVGMEIPR